MTQHEMRRKDRRLTEEEARKILADGEYGILSTVGEDSQPYGTPLNYIAEGDSIWFHCARTGHKLDNLAANPRVCFTVVGKTKPVHDKNFSTLFESAVVFGSAERVAEDGEKLRVLETLCRKYLPEHMDKFEAEAIPSLPATTVWRIAVERITGKAKR